MNVVMLTAANFNTTTARPGLLSVIEFSTKEKKNAAGANNASAKMDAIFDEVAKGYTDTEKLNFFRVEILLDSELVDTLNPVTSKKYLINHGPTIVFIRGGKEVIDQQVGQCFNDALKGKVDEALALKV